MNYLKRHSVWIIVLILLLTLGFFTYLLFTGFSDRTEVVAIGIAALSALFAAFSGAASWVQAVEAQRQRELHERPLVTGRFEGSYGGFVFFILENTGNSPALDVRMKFEPSPRDYSGRALNEVSLFKEPIAFFPPGVTYRQLINGSHKYFEEGNPLEFKLSIEYKTTAGKPISETIDYDLAYLKDSHLPLRTTRESLHKGVEELEKLQKLLKRMEKGGALIVEAQSDYLARLEERARAARSRDDEG